MDVFNKFYSTVSTTVSQLQGVLPGNPVTREYEVIAHVASAGSGKNVTLHVPQVLWEPVQILNILRYCTGKQSVTS